jgi:hypothetical protein
MRIFVSGAGFARNIFTAADPALDGAQRPDNLAPVPSQTRQGNAP